MPKTFTDDIGAALPSAIDGPFQVTDPSDAASWIRIDPALARVEAAGDARPTRAVSAVFDRTYLSVGLASIGSHLPARSVAAGVKGGYYTVPIRVPDDIDPAAPASIVILVSPAADSAANGQILRFGLDYTRVEASDGSRSEGATAMDWPVPDDWTTSDSGLVVIDNGNGWSFDANTFAPADWLGVRVFRDGAHANDDFNQGLVIADTLALVYRAKTY